LELPIYQVDAFADTLFGGNPAAVVPLEAWLPDALMQQIAAENNLAETAFFVRELDGYALRWFTPTVEVPLCGHATLAAAHVVFRFMRPEARVVRFKSVKSGVLTVTREDPLLALDFPSLPLSPTPAPDGLLAALGLPDGAVGPEAVAGLRNLMCVFGDGSAIAALAPDFRALARLPVDGVVVTAPGSGAIDFVSRYFAPAMGIDEDPATGSTHCHLIPYWAERLGRGTLMARQISRRGATLVCADLGDRVSIAGRAQLYLQGTIFLP
jgi:PhzF family phenazine biosynthesis protein